jgi:hypothetical protein
LATLTVMPPRNRTESGIIESGGFCAATQEGPIANATGTARSHLRETQECKMLLRSMRTRIDTEECTKAGA